MFKDCYASFDAEKGLLLIGNSSAEKSIRINGSFIATEWVKDKINGKAQAYYFEDKRFM